MLDVFDLRLLNVGYHDNWQEWQWKNVCSPFARIYFVDKGTASLLIDGEERMLEAGNLYYIPPFKKHSCVGKRDFAHYYMHLYEWPASGVSLFNEANFISQSPARRGDKEIFQMLLQIFPENQLGVVDPEVYDTDEGLQSSCTQFLNRIPSEQFLAKGAMLVLLSRLLDTDGMEASRRNPKIVKACNFINANIGTELTIGQLAELSCMSESNFMRVFKKEKSMTPAQYIIRRRIEIAQLYLLLKDEPVKNIAASVGFLDPSYFVKSFKKITGMTPLEFRLSPSSGKGD